MRPADITSSSNIDSGIGNIDKGPKVKVDDHVRISKTKRLRIFVKDYAPKLVRRSVYD